MTKCALCKEPARTFCESDQAALCWDCDARVHGANFLVARHTRTLLCHSCQCKTPWTASGAKLGHTVSVCDGCVNGVHRQTTGDEESGDHRDDDDDISDEDDETDDDEDEGDLVEDEDSAGDGSGDEGEGGGSDGDDEDGDNQVVPWSFSDSSPPPNSSSSSDESVSRFYLNLMDRMCSLKRTRVSSSSTDLPSLETLRDSSSRRRRKVSPTVSKTQFFNIEAVSISSSRPVSSPRIRSERRVGTSSH